MKHSVPKNYDLKQDKNAAPGRFQAFCADFFHHIDLLQIIPMLILLTIGAVFIYGIGQQVGGFAAATFWKRHLIYMGIGLAFWIAHSLITAGSGPPPRFCIRSVSCCWSMFWFTE